MLDAGAEAGRRSARVPCRRRRRARPEFDGGIVTRLDSVPLGIVVNKHGERFYDEGEDVWPKRYAIWGRLIAAQPDQIAYSIVDAKAVGTFMPSVFPPIVGGSIASWPRGSACRPSVLEATVARSTIRFAPGTFDHRMLDDCRTEGVDSPDKTHWAQRTRHTAVLGVSASARITFTYLGVKVDDSGRVLMTERRARDNVYAAGEIMAGNVLREGTSPVSA